MASAEGVCAVTEPGGGDGGGEVPVDGESGGEEGGGYVAPVALPNTGSGIEGVDSTGSLLTAGLAAGAAALLVGNKLKSALKAEEQKVIE